MRRRAKRLTPTSRARLARAGSRAPRPSKCRIDAARHAGEVAHPLASAIQPSARGASTDMKGAPPRARRPASSRIFEADCAEAVSKGAYVSETGKNDCPAPSRAAMALKALGLGRRAIKAKVSGKASTLQFWRINLDYVWSWAREVGLGDVEQMRNYVATPK